MAHGLREDEVTLMDDAVLKIIFAPEQVGNLDGERRQGKAMDRLAGVIPIRFPRPANDTRYLEFNISSVFQEDDPDNDEDGGAVICQPDRLPHNQRPDSQGDNRRDIADGRGGYRAKFFQRCSNR